MRARVRTYVRTYEYPSIRLRPLCMHAWTYISLRRTIITLLALYSLLWPELEAHNLQFAKINLLLLVFNSFSLLFIRTANGQLGSYQHACTIIGQSIHPFVYPLPYVLFCVPNWKESKLSYKAEERWTDAD